MDIEKSKFVRVTMTVDFIVPDYESDLEGTLDDWFGKKFNGRHTYRDNREVGGSKKFLNAKIYTFEEFEEIIANEKRTKMSKVL